MQKRNRKVILQLRQLLYRLFKFLNVSCHKKVIWLHFDIVREFDRYLGGIIIDKCEFFHVDKTPHFGSDSQQQKVILPCLV